MEWIILAVVSWILFLVLVDWRTLGRNIWCGLAAVLLQILVDNTGISHGLYEIRKCNLCIVHSSSMFTFGPVLVVGILTAQYYPKTKALKIISVGVLAILYTLQEILLLARENVVYTNWHMTDSIGVNLMAMIIINWFAIIIFNKNGEEG
ncbi:MAG TPA: hypothetical protein VD757_02745 [Candidatus Nitrosocosmicus sp.]|nr:hypothetical protein [Candidatus Nitrosocosmicus sp.]